MRESKPEDIQIIAELKSLLTERDQVIKKLIVRYFLFSTTMSVIGKLLVGEAWGSVFE